MLGFVILATAIDFLIPLFVGVLCLLAGAAVAFFLLRLHYKKAGLDANKIIEDAKKNAEDNRKKIVLETKQELFKLKQDSEKEIKQAKIDCDREIKERKKSVLESEQNSIAQVFAPSISKIERGNSLSEIKHS